jgi:hypothetical protein
MADVSDEMATHRMIRIPRISWIRGQVQRGEGAWRDSTIVVASPSSTFL